jgi:hypothetical protein
MTKSESSEPKLKLAKRVLFDQVFIENNSPTNYKYETERLDCA